MRRVLFSLFPALLVPTLASANPTLPLFFEGNLGQATPSRRR